MDTDGHNPSLFLLVRLSGSPIARDFSTSAHSKRTTTSYTSFLSGRSPRVTVENFSKGTCGTNDRSIIILTKETTKPSALLAVSAQHVCIRRSLSHEVTCVGHKSKRAKRALASDLLRKTIITLRAFKE